MTVMLIQAAPKVHAQLSLTTRAYNLDLYLEDQLKFADRWSVVQGVQLSYADRQITDYFQTNGDDSGNAVYRLINPKAGILYDLTETSQAFFGYSRSYEPPTFSELFNSSGDFLNNKAQRGHTCETGARRRRDLRLRRHILLFHSRQGIAEFKRQLGQSA